MASSGELSGRPGDVRLTERGGIGTQRARRIAVAVFLLAAFAALLWGLLRAAPNWERWIHEVPPGGWRLDAARLSGAVGAAVAALLGTAWLWARLFRIAGGRLPVPEAMATWLGSNLGRYVPGKIWQLVGIAGYLAARGDSAAAGFTVSLALPVIMLATGAALGVGFIGAAAFGGFGPSSIAIGLLVAVGAVHPATLRWLVRLGRRWLRESGPSAVVEISGRSLVGAAAVCVAMWGLYGFGFWLLIGGLMPSSPFGIPAATGIFAAGYVLGYVVLLAPGGIVVREGTIAGLLGTTAGLAAGPAAAVAVAARLWTIVAEILAFSIAAILRMRHTPEAG